MSRSTPRRWTGPSLALLAALAFALSVPASKILLRDTPQFALAGLLYLGAGLTLTAYRLMSRLVGRASNNNTRCAGPPSPTGSGSRRPPCRERSPLPYSSSGD